MAKAGPRKARSNPEEAKASLIEGAIQVLARDGFTRTSARAVAAEAGGTNGLIFYHFGSMDELFAATAAELSDRRITRVKAALGGDEAAIHWPDRLADTIQAEATSPEGIAVVELLVAARTSPALSQPVGQAIDRSIQFATEELRTVLAGSPWSQLLPVDLVAELATAAFFGLELFTQAERPIDLDRLARLLALGISQLQHLSPPQG